MEPLILVTGSTDGIGKATAGALVRQGARVILHGRSRAKAREVQRELQEVSGGEKPDILVADFSAQDEVRSMADEVVSTFPKLDVLINNAGTYQEARTLTDDGVEMTFAVNYLAPFLLTGLLLPLLRESAPSRIVNVASSAHEDVSRIDWDNLPDMPRYDPWEAYSLSKFGDIVFTYLLAEKLEGSGVTVNCLHPGVTDTKILNNAFPGMRGISPEEGARTSVYLAVSPEVAGVSGKYFEEMQPAGSTALTHDRAVQERFWKIAEDLTGLE
ncbi:NAD(P)-dependent dehydrogenase (short-subunit alcohol dehydrogenase family) [Methanolinea mesophila]|uniref:SDR family oxidoreductase n=1 Tax=Methanolinea mesophila TaxID=547055 RepID=UPI001AE8C96C|nr:SDR family oxidoreductase [Methanolinea mesophila]MBP1929501.1 NAD(P)-dependent dehydrogenase (short-subunit alcohol dehydrogenase family) [Methanolinea mesophila]